MDKNKNITAVFEKIPTDTYKLTKIVLPVSGGSISASPDKTSYNKDESVTLAAEPDSCYDFTGWSGDCSDANPVCTLTMNSDKSVTANFRIKTYTLNIASANG
ncbi:MAG: cell wall-binding protein, partial [Desulfobacteraceae bacterium]|nr:cell wall-binding protein [Desulfobacteraceae bacterium]